MKTHIALALTILFLLSQKTELLADQKPVESKIENVTVFVAGAQVGRTASVAIPAGRTELIFKGISPEIDPQSIQVKGEGPFTILSVIHQMNYREEQAKRKEIADLELEKIQFLRQQKENKAQLTVFQKEEKMLEKNQSVGGANTGVDSEELRRSLDLHRQRMTEIFMEKLQLERSLFSIDSTLKKIDAQLVALNQERETATSEVLVKVNAEAPVTAKFGLTYYVRDAGWFATYDFRVKDVSSPIDIAFKANVFQHSGEDWNNVDLKLSNGNPTESGVMTELAPWYLGYGYRNSVSSPGVLGSGGINSVAGKVIDAETGQPIAFATVMVRGTTIGTNTDFDGNYSMQIPTAPSALVVSFVGYQTVEVPITSFRHDLAVSSAGVQLEAIVVEGKRSRKKSHYIDGIRVNGLGVKKNNLKKESNIIRITETYQPTTVTFEIELKYTIPSDGKTRTVDIKNENVPAEYHYFAAPKVDENAYLTANITDWQELNLLDGEVNLFFEGAFLGRSLVDTKSVGDTLEVSLGQDKGIVVKRKKIKDFSKRQFIGGSKTESRAFEIFVKNNKRQPVHITIEDQFPISTKKEISVENLKYDGATRDEKTNILTWDLELQPREERKLEMRYSVKYPKKKVVALE